MKIFLLFLCLALLYISCNFIDFSNQTGTKVNLKDSTDKSITIAIDAENIPLEKIEKGKNTNEKSPEYIEKTIDQLIGKTLKKWTDDAHVTYPPACILFRAFKIEH